MGNDDVGDKWFCLVDVELAVLFEIVSVNLSLKPYESDVLDALSFTDGGTSATI